MGCASYVVIFIRSPFLRASDKVLLMSTHNIFSYRIVKNIYLDKYRNELRCLNITGKHSMAFAGLW